MFSNQRKPRVKNRIEIKLKLLIHLLDIVIIIWVIKELGFFRNRKCHVHLLLYDFHSSFRLTLVNLGMALDCKFKLLRVLSVMWSYPSSGTARSPSLSGLPQVAPGMKISFFSLSLRPLVSPT